MMDAELAWAMGLVAGCLMKGNASVDVPVDDDDNFTNRIRFTFPETTVDGEPRWFEMAVVPDGEGDDSAALTALVIEALGTEGAHHKQWFLHRIALLIDPEMDLRRYDTGVPT